MNTSLLLATLVSAGLLAPPVALSFELDSREYKLMLDPQRFSGTPSTDAANRFWDDMLKAIIECRLDARDDGEPWHKKKFKLDEERTVRFWDTDDCELDRRGYVLRERVDIRGGQEDSSKREVTLKLRTPDLFLAAGTPLPAADDQAEVKLEENIAVLLVRAEDSPGVKRTVVARPPSMRSLFSRSVSQPLAAEASLASPEVVTDLYPGLSDLDILDGRASNLVRGEPVREYVFEGAKVDLGRDVDAGFALALWYPGDRTGGWAPAIAEISFKYDTDEGDVAPAVAQRAMALFLAMQAELAWASPERATKTSFGLPEGCGR
jgi:hypothetical protein